MVVTIDGTSRLPTSFSFLVESNVLFDVRLIIKEKRKELNETADESQELGAHQTTILSGESLHLFPDHQPRDRLVGDMSFISAESLHLSRLTDNDASLVLGDPDLESSRVSELDDTVETIPLQWERYSHKVLLAQHSSRFRELLVRVWLELETQPLTNQAVIEDDFFFARIVEIEQRRYVEIELKNVRSSSCESILDYIYTGCLKFDEENFLSLVQDAQILGFESVTELCDEHILQEQSFTNWGSVLLCSLHSNNEEIMDRCFHFLKENIDNDEFIPELTDNFPRLPMEFVDKLMSSEVVDEVNAEMFFQLILNWVAADTKERQRYVYGLMQNKIAYVTQEFLLDVLATNDIVSPDVRLKLVTTAMRMKQLSLSDSSTWNAVRSSLSQQSLLSGQSDQSETLLVLTGVFKDEGNGVHEKFDRESNMWSEWTTKDLGLGYGVAALRDLMLVIGGVLHQKITRTVQIYNFNQQKWTAGPNMNQPRAIFGCSVVDGHSILVCGGKTTGNEVFAECEMLQLDTSGQGTWRPITPMSVKRMNFSSACLNNKVYVCGGSDILDDKTCTVYSSVEEYDLKTKQWRKRSDMKEARTNFGIATHQNMIYVFGGWRDMRNLSTCERYDPSTDTWQYICSLPSPRQSLTEGLLGDKIYIIGGTQKDNWSNTTDVYDVEQKKFSRGPNLNHAAYRPRCVVVKKNYLK